MKLARFKVKTDGDLESQRYATGLVVDDSRADRVSVWFCGKIIERRVKRDEVTMVPSASWRTFYHGPPRPQPPKPVDPTRSLTPEEIANARWKWERHQRNHAAIQADRARFNDGTFIPPKWQPEAET